MFRQRPDQVGDESLRVTIKGVEREPANRHLYVMRQIDQQRGLAIARRSGEEQEFVIEQCLEMLQQTGAREQLPAALRNNDLGLTDRNRLSHFSENVPRSE